MRTYSRFIISFIAAIITYSSLMAFVGPQCHTYQHHRHNYHNNCNKFGNEQAPITDSATKL